VATIYGLKIKKIKEAIEETESQIDTDQKKLKAARIVSTDAQRMSVSLWRNIRCFEGKNSPLLEWRLGPN
jgi:hypothetical protein